MAIISLCCRIIDMCIQQYAYFCAVNTAQLGDIGILVMR